ncbi:MAG: TonB family protein [Polyangiales bacterium]
MLWPRAPIRYALSASALMHLGMAVALTEVEPPRMRPPARPPPSFTVPFEPTRGGGESSDRPRASAKEPEVVPGGPPVTGMLDRREPEGRGGERAAEEQGALLMPFVSPLTLQDTELNNLAVNQVQRIRTAPERATLEERRATPNPADAVLLASGAHGHQERRTPSKHDAVRGAPARTIPSLASVVQSAREPVPDGPGELAPPIPADNARGETADAHEAARAVPAEGIQGGRGAVAKRAARVAHARPNVDRGPAATPAETVEEKIRDDADAELLAAKLQRSFVDTSVQRATQTGAGSGGATLDPRALGERGAGTGARARPYTPGSGSFGALDTSDARYLHWFTQQRTRVQDALKFPRARAIAKDQGTSLYSVTLGRDGALSEKPKLVRSSGFADFDQAARVAIEHALPFAPLPKELAPALTRISVLVPVAFSNPMVE